MTIINKSLALVLSTSLFAALSQFFLKKTVLATSLSSGEGTSRSLLVIVKELSSSGYFWLCILMSGAAFVSALLSLRSLELTTYSPLVGAFFYLIIFAMGTFFLREPLTFQKIIGTVLIIGGISLLVR